MNHTLDKAADIVAAWDRGETVFSLSMGGLGPGYDQCIQVAVIELLRDQDGKDLPPRKDGAETPEEAEARRSWGDDTIDRISSELGGMSGAQVGAAKWLAFQILTKGWQDVARRAKEHGEEDRIQQFERGPLPAIAEGPS